MNFGIGYSEIAVILLFALIFIGPRKLPQLMRDIGRVLGQLRKTADDLRREVMFSDEITEFRDAVRSVVDPPMPPPKPPKLKLKPEEDQKSKSLGQDQLDQPDSLREASSLPIASADGVSISPVYQDPPPALDQKSKSFRPDQQDQEDSLITASSDLVNPVDPVKNSSLPIAPASPLKDRPHDG